VAASQTDRELARWGEDPRLVDLLGERGAEGFRAMFDGYSDLVGVVWPVRDEQGRIVDFSFGYGNPAMMRAFRVPADISERYTLLEALPRMRDSHAFDAYVRTCESGEPWVEEITYDTPFGDGYMLGTYILRTTKLGDGAVVFLTDVTEQRRMEGELRSYADVVAHDLREPVANMALLVRLLERTSSEPPPPDVLQLLREGIDRAQELITAVLVYAQVGELARERVALAEVVGGVEEDLRTALDDAGATLECGELPEVEGDRSQLRRVLQNLVGNAVRFRSETPPVIEVSAERGSREWIVTVSDNGIGVPPDQVSRIFGMFARVDAGSEGTGIGLAVCRRIVEAHGGRIWVEPRRRGGSDFRFTLPA
jgi:signal transduction histidine kinase